jgi:TonB family protein
MKTSSYILVAAAAAVLTGCVSRESKREQEREYIQAVNEQFARADAGGNDQLVGIAKDMADHANIIFPDECAVIEAAKKAGKTITLPRMISAPQPSYPVFSQITHSQGYIWVAFIVGTSGNVEQAKALEDPDSTIAQAAINAVKKWKFVPGRIDGSPAQLLLTVPVSFQTAN